MLKFIGRGSAFNTSEGNNSSFLIKGDKLLLIDCGSDVFSRIKKMDLLKGIKTIEVLITHCHPDHIGSLGDLIFYSFYMVGEKGKPCLRIYHYSPSLENILMDMGVYPSMYFVSKFKNPNLGKKTKLEIGIYVRPILVEHYPSHPNGKTFTSIGFMFDLEDKSTIYYSGDCNEIPQEILYKFYIGEISAFYQDVSTYDFKDNPHLSYKRLLEAIPASLRRKVFIMHIDEHFDFKRAKSDGFNVVRRYE